MPLKRRYKRKRRYKKKKYGYKKRRRPRRGKINWLKLKGVSSFPDQMYVKMKYSDVITVDTGAVAGQVYSINSLFDPDTTGVGHQPLGYDQWSNLYGKYEVLGCAMKLSLISNGNNRFGIILYPSNSATAVSDTATAKEQRYAIHRYAASTTASMDTHINTYMSVKKLEARNTSSINFRGTTGNIGFGSSPTIQKYWHILVYALDGLGPVNCFIDVNLKYYCKLHDPISIAGS